jgi:hypothetical protein
MHFSFDIDNVQLFWKSSQQDIMVGKLIHFLFRLSLRTVQVAVTHSLHPKNSYNLIYSDLLPVAGFARSLESPSILEKKFPA